MGGGLSAKWWSLWPVSACNSDISTIDQPRHLGIQETRAKSLAEFSKRDDAWLMAVDKDWPWGPTNNYCKWFHVTEHEANHNGQIKLLKSRVPGAKPATE